MKETYSTTIYQWSDQLSSEYRDDLTNKDYDISSQYRTTLLTNGSFDTWTLGASLAPDGWTLSHFGSGGGTVARESTIIKEGTYSTLLTNGSTAGDVTYLDQNVSGAGFAAYRGKVVSFGAWVWSNSAYSAIQLLDGVDNTELRHPGDSSWHYLSSTLTISMSASTIIFRCKAVVATKIAYFSYPFMVISRNASNSFYTQVVSTATSTSWCCDRCGFSYPKTKLQKVGRLELCSKCIDKEQED